ncbi:ribonuclease H [Trifolium pratense]|uniref:Ribonuclease H n=1 Tax=Trifolium pratense TaxID=57577 RepID=A0A2K3P1N3_TRIPR|nr:ribonuclease H [Trifolium pratense]
MIKAPQTRRRRDVSSAILILVSSVLKAFGAKQGVVKKMGNGVQTSFWEDTWVGDISLRERFPRMFSISIQKEASVASLRNLNGGERWDLVWRRRLFVWESNLLDELLMIISPVSLSEAVNKWVWRPEKGEGFTVKSTYALVSDMIIARGSISQEKQSAFKAIWKCPAPSKVSGLVWTILHDRAPTRVNLFRRRVIQEEGD